MPQQLVEKNRKSQHLAGLQSDIADLLARVRRLEAARPPPKEKLLSQEEAAVVLGVKPPTLAQWRFYGKGPRYIRVGRSAFYKLQDVNRWLDSQAVIPIPRIPEGA
jgi:hypothetical protein